VICNTFSDCSRLGKDIATTASARMMNMILHNNPSAVIAPGATAPFLIHSSEAATSSSGSSRSRSQRGCPLAGSQPN